MKLKQMISSILTAALISVSIFTTSAATVNQSLEVHHINVGQGESIYIEFPDGTDVLIDAGKSNYGKIVVDYLNSQEKSMEVDYLIATHPDADHVGGMQDVFESMKVKNFIYPIDAPHDTKTWKNVLSLAQAEGCTIKDSTPGTTFNLGGATMKFIQSSKDFSDNNDDSIVTYLDYKDAEFLFTGDIEATAEKDMVSNGLVPNVDFMTVPHHGSKGSSTTEFVTKADPEYAIVSVGQNSYGHPTADALNKYSNIDAKIYRTDQVGNIVIKTDGNTATINGSKVDIGGSESVVKPSVNSSKLAGDDRYQTAIKVSNNGWSSAENVVLVNSSSIVDALSATPFAKMKDAPILLTEKDKLNSKTKTEISRLKIKNVYIIGGKNVISDSIVNELKSMNINVERISGDDRYKTSLEIAKRLGNISEIAVVNGVKGLPDAISIAPVAASKKMPIVLASPTEGTKVFDEYIKSQNISKSYVIGKEAAISNEIANKLPNVQRLGGNDRNETNSVIINQFYTDKNLNNIYVTKDGMNKQDDLIDALAVGVLASKQNSPVLIVGKDLNTNQKNVLSNKQPKEITQVGGNGNENAFNSLVSMFK